MADKKVSLIISAYNEEKYLRQCLDSVRNQSLEDIEVIVFNDGSTDRTSEILEDYPEFNVINQENIGLGASRNKGIDLATGEYIAFLDGDDWLAEDALKTAYMEAKSRNADITMFQIINYNDQTGEEKKNDWFNLDKFDESFTDTVFDSSRTKDFLFHLSVSACQKIYRREFIRDIEAKFPEKIYFEDNPFSYYVWLKASRISIIKRYLYYRRSHDSSITAKCDEKFLDIIPSGKILFKIFIDNSYYEEYKKDLINYTINAYRLTINSITKDSVEEFYRRSRIEFENIYKSEYYKDFDEYMSEANKEVFLNILNTHSYDEFKKLNKNPKGKF